MSFVSPARQGFLLESDNDAALVFDYDNNRGFNPNNDPEPRDSSASTNPHERSPIDSNLLSPFLSANSDSLSPTNPFETSNASISCLSYNPSSDLSDFEEDPFFGASFADPGVDTPLFLENQLVWDPSLAIPSLSGPENGAAKTATYLLTPDQSASTDAAPPTSPETSVTMQRSFSSPQGLQQSAKPTPLIIPASPWAQSQPDSGPSCPSEDGLAPAPVDMRSQSPLVTVSMWGDKDSSGHVHTVERTFEGSPTTERGGGPPASEDPILSISPTSRDWSSVPQPRDSMGQWQRDPATGLAGLSPTRRMHEEGPSINELARRQQLSEKNDEVGKWLIQHTQSTIAVQEKSADEISAIEEENRRSNNDNIPLGNDTENCYVLGRTYYQTDGNAGGQMTQQDYDIILANRNWADHPALHGIHHGTPGQYQPQTSQAAIERFEKMCRDNDSIISRAATWGTRRRSLPDVSDLDVEGITSGSFLKKLSISRSGGSKPGGSLFRDLRGLVRRPSAATIRKRSRSGQREDATEQQQSQRQQRQSEDNTQAKRESVTHLSPISRTSSWGKKQTPSIGETLISMGQNFASIGASHSRSCSISNVPTAPLKQSLSSLSVKTSLRRPRSKSELPTSYSGAASGASRSILGDLWRRSGGPPVPSMTKTHVEPEDDEDDDDEIYEDNDMRMNPNLIDDIPPTFAGFQQHIRRLNPESTMPTFLVDRIAHQQIVRYKQLLSYKVKHLGLGPNCPNGSLCPAMGGAAKIQDLKGEAREADPLSAGFDADADADAASAEGVINQDSFPADIPMPPTQRLPAEFECQLCYESKDFKKPSDWTKHVHEDVQPFTCTWEKCREPKMFKRKADWVRHENEGHRHLEWWTCDVEDCQHTCYRRDNFLQHLVREHKFAEPKVKTKAALKKAHNLDPTWQKVEQSHRETSKQPHEEACRFCGRQFPTWKKLTVHLAKHMEQIALPVLRLVAVKAKELNADTIISPVRDPPSRQHEMLFSVEQTHHQISPALPYASPPQPQLQVQVQPQPQMRVGPQMLEVQVQQAQPQMATQPPSTFSQAQLPLFQQQEGRQRQGQFMYPVIPPGQFPPSFYSPRFDGVGGASYQQSSMGVGRQNQGMSPGSVGFLQGPEGFQVEELQALNALGLQNVGGVPMVAGGQMMYDGMMDSGAEASPFGGHENLSPYSRSPRWDEGQFM